MSDSTRQLKLHLRIHEVGLRRLADAGRLRVAVAANCPCPPQCGGGPLGAFAGRQFNIVKAVTCHLSFWIYDGRV